MAKWEVTDLFSMTQLSLATEQAGAPRPRKARLMYLLFIRYNTFMIFCYSS